MPSEGRSDRDVSAEGWLHEITFIRQSYSSSQLQHRPFAKMLNLTTQQQLDQLTQATTALMQSSSQHNHKIDALTDKIDALTGKTGALTDQIGHLTEGFAEIKLTAERQAEAAERQAATAERQERNIDRLVGIVDRLLQDRTA